jgi:hypothetical protein
MVFGVWPHRQGGCHSDGHIEECRDGTNVPNVWVAEAGLAQRDAIGLGDGMD